MIPTDPTDRAPDPLRATVREGRGALAVLAVFGACINLLVLTTHVYMMQMFDRVLASGRVETLVFLTLIAGIAVLAMGLIETVRGRILGRVGRWLDRRLSPSLIEAGLKGAAAGIATSAQPLRDLATLRGFLGSPGLTALLDAPWVPGFLVVIWLMHPWLGWLGLGAALVLLALAAIHDLAARRGLHAAEQGAIDNLQSVDVALRNAESFQAMGMAPAFLANWVRRNDAVSARHLAATDLGALVLGFSKFLRMFVQIAVLGLGAYLVLEGELTPGGMIAASILLGRALAPVEMAIGVWKGLLGARSAYRRLKTVCAAFPPAPAPMPLPSPRGWLACEQVTHLLPGREPPVLEGVSFTLEPGEAMGLIGPSAAGKSTLCKVLVGAWRPTAGQVRLDGAELGLWPREQLGRAVGYLPQDVELFRGTVKDNIARLDPEADPRTVVEAATAAGAHEAILKLPEGYATEIGERGCHLSGGQHQRIGLARALYGRPRLIVLDEPNANLDYEGETALVTAIAKAKRWGAAVVLVAHHPRIIQPADKLLVLNDGRVEMAGSRDAVMAELRARSGVAEFKPKAPPARVEAPA